MDPVASYVGRFALDKILSEDLLDSLRALRYAPGETYTSARPNLRRLLFFVDGKAKVYSRMENGSSLLVRFYTPFDILGDVELFAFDRCLLDVVALSETVCLALDAAPSGGRPRGTAAFSPTSAAGSAPSSPTSTRAPRSICAIPSRTASRATSSPRRTRAARRSPRRTSASSPTSSARATATLARRRALPRRGHALS